MGDMHGAASIVAFTPKASLKQTIRVAKGVQLASEQVDGTSCLFRTCYDVDVHPLSLLDAVLEEKPGKAPTIRLNLALNDLSLDEWRPEALRFYLGGDANQAADIYMLLHQHLNRIVLTSADAGEACILPPAHLKPVGFAENEDLLPYPSQSFPGYRIIQEYFILPEKFLFLDVTGWERWKGRGKGSGFQLCFELKKMPAGPPRVRRESFVLAATPVINLFSHDADPIRLDHRQADYMVRPTGSNDINYQVYQVSRVTGFVQGTAKERTYAPFEVFSAGDEQQPTYHTQIRRSPIRPGFDFYLSVAYPASVESPPTETLSLQLECTNGFLPEGLQIGDICHPTSSTPEFVEFKNIRPPTSSILPPIGQNLLWHFLSHLCLNYRTLADAENLRALLSLYNFEENRDRPAFLANQKRLVGLQAVRSSPADCLVGGVIMRGREIQCDVRQDHFAGLGDLYLFGSVLDRFLGSYASLNTYTQLRMKEILRGEVYLWPARVGDHPLI